MQRERTKDQECKVNTIRSKKKHRIYFDLDATYSVCYISRILGVSQRVALKYVHPNGVLTEKGIQTLQDINEELIQKQSVC